MTKKVAPKLAKAAGQVFIVLGFDDLHKPCGARYVDPNVDVLVKAAAAMHLNLFEVKSPTLAKIVQTLPNGRLLSTGKGLVTNIRQDLYSEIVSEIACDPKAAPLRGKGDGNLPAQKGPPENWGAIGIGHLVIAQETLDHGWAEAIVTDRVHDLLTLRYRDCPTIPKFYRHYRAVALLSPSAT